MFYFGFGWDNKLSLSVLHVLHVERIAIFENRLWLQFVERVKKGCGLKN